MSSLKATHQKWSQLLNSIRSFLVEYDCLEIQTPILVPTGAFENNLDVFELQHQGETFQLPSSPEIAMKCLIPKLRQNVFQIARSFRKDPVSPIHSPEFTLLEFYLWDKKIETLTELTEKLLRTLVPPSELQEPLHFRHLSVPDLFVRELGWSPVEFSDTASLALKVANTTSIHVSPEDNWHDLFFKLVMEKIEPSLNPNEVTFIHDFPVKVSPLSAPNPRSPELALRFEIYWHGMELANGCQELWSRTALEKRYEAESSLRNERGASAHPRPEALLRAMEHSIAPLAGVAIGLDRLFTCLHGLPSIHNLD